MRKILMTVALPLLALLGVTGCEVPADEPVAVQSAEPGKKGGESKAPKPTPIKLQARRAKASASVLSDGSALSCVKITVTNQTSKQLEVNPLYFSIIDATGEKHDSSDALGDYEGQIATTELAPKEKVTGMVCGKGKFTPKQVAMTNPLFDEAARAEVS